MPQRLVEVEQSLPTKIQLNSLRSLIKRIKKCEEWSELASLDIKRQRHFSINMIWCIDFSEIRVFLEKNEQQPSALHLVDYLAFRQSKPRETLLILPGTVFEILSFLENLIQKSTLSHSKFITSEIKAKIEKAKSSDEKGKIILEFISDKADKSIEDAVNRLRKTEPSVLRLQSLLRSENIKFFHKEYKRDIRKLHWYPNFFAKIYDYLHKRRDRLSINNYNDALNLSICNSLNKNISEEKKYFTYVTRDRVCMEASKQHPWHNDPITKLNPTEDIPICRDPYSVFLFLGDIAGSNDSAELYKNCFEFVEKLVNLPEYIEAIKEWESTGSSNITVDFDKYPSSFTSLSETLKNLLGKYGILIYKAIEQTEYFDDFGTDSYKPLNIGEFPKRELLVGTRSLEHLTTALGLAYNDLSSQNEDAGKIVEELLHRERGESGITVQTLYDKDFDSKSFVLESTSALESVIGIIEIFNRKTEDFYYSSWWSSISDISVFADVVKYFWNSVRQNPQIELPEDEQKVFETGITLVTKVVSNGKLKEEIRTETYVDLIALLEDEDLLRQYMEKYHLSAIRLNTRAGDFWLNFAIDYDTSPRMGIISHIWDPTLMAQMIAYTSKHYTSIMDLEEKLKEIEFN